MGPCNHCSEVPALHDVAVHLHPDDNVAIARTGLEAGQVLTLGPEGIPAERICIHQAIPVGHKLALQDIAAGDAIRRYGQTIGFASQDIEPGEHVHSHNLHVEGFEREYAFGADVRPVMAVPESERRTFLGYQRPDGRVATRNYIAVISSVNCSAHASREIAHYFTPERLAAHPNVDGVIALTHAQGCDVRIGSPNYALLQRTLAGFARHPNVAAYILVGLGCEGNRIDDLVRNYDLYHNGILPGAAPVLSIQSLGGIRKTVQAGIATIEELLPAVDANRRTPQPISELTIGVQCGGSDGWSGMTANPAMGLVADEIVRQGGTIVLSETPEICGAEHLLTRRAISPEVGQKLVALVSWWEAHARQAGMQLNDNLSPGNRAGGLTTIYEKSLGAVAKGGSTPLNAVYDYAEPVTARGLTFMNAPGNDWTAITGQSAAGCTLILFSTGRGSVLGFRPTPVIKIASNPALFEHMADDMDVNAGRVLEGAGLEEVASELLDVAIAVASGHPSKSEWQGVGEAEFAPWFLGGML
jgi:altronate hydrolase